MPRYIKGAEPFEMHGGDRGVLLIHGFTGTPFEMRPLGEALAAEGYAVSAPALAGHSTWPADMELTRWSDWCQTARASFFALRRRCKKVYVAGLSMGGLISLKLAADMPDDVAALAVLAAPVWMNGINWGFATASAFTPLRFVMPFVRKPEPDGERLRAIREKNPGYAVVPTRSAASLWWAMMRMRPEATKVRSPALLIYSRVDGEVPYANLRILSALIGSREKKEVTLERSSHLMTLDIEAGIVINEVKSFFSKH
jgi:carboxylesterase